MDDFSEKVNQILSDPAQMAKVMEMAAKLGGTQEAPKETFSVAPEQLQRMISLLGSSDGKEECLLRALMPFLTPEKAQKMTRAVHAAKLSKIITRVLQEQHSGQEAGCTVGI